MALSHRQNTWPLLHSIQRSISRQCPCSTREIWPQHHHLDPRLQTKAKNCHAGEKDLEKVESWEYRGTARLLRVYGLEHLWARVYRSWRIHRHCDGLRKLLCGIVHPHMDSRSVSTLTTSRGSRKRWKTNLWLRTLPSGVATTRSSRGLSPTRAGQLPEPKQSTRTSWTNWTSSMPVLTGSTLLLRSPFTFTLPPRWLQLPLPDLPPHVTPLPLVISCRLQPPPPFPPDRPLVISCRLQPPPPTPPTGLASGHQLSPPAPPAPPPPPHRTGLWSSAVASSPHPHHPSHWTGLWSSDIASSTPNRTFCCCSSLAASCWPPPPPPPPPDHYPVFTCGLTLCQGHRNRHSSYRKGRSEAFSRARTPGKRQALTTCPLPPWDRVQTSWLQCSLLCSTSRWSNATSHNSSRPPP